MRTVLLALTALCAVETIARAQDCTTAPADLPPTILYLLPWDSRAWLTGPTSYGHPGCDRLVVDFVNNQGAAAFIAARIAFPETAANAGECDVVTSSSVANSPYDVIRLAVGAERRDILGVGYSQIGPIQVTDLEY